MLKHFAALLAQGGANDPLLEVMVHTHSQGFAFSRELLRIAAGSDVEFTSHLAAHRADFRPALRFQVRAFPSFFVSEVEGLADFEGLGGYTWNMSAANASRLLAEPPCATPAEPRSRCSARS